MARAYYIEWHVNDVDADYEVFVFGDDGRIVDHYRAGNSPHDSQVYMGKGNSADRETMRKWAEITADEMAKEYGIPPERIEEELRT